MSIQARHVNHDRTVDQTTSTVEDARNSENENSKGSLNSYYLCLVVADDDEQSGLEPLTTEERNSLAHEHPSLIMELV